MMQLLIAALTVFAAAASPDAELLASRASSPAERFGAFRSLFNKQYEVEEVAVRRAVFLANDARIAAHALKNASYTLAHNEFSDMTWAEFRATHLGFTPPNLRGPKNVDADLEALTAASLPDSVDWVAAGAVTPVKNQGQCGGCWAFSTTGAVEGAYFLASGRKTLVSLSEQELVSCEEDMQGCDGGIMDPAFDWIRRVGGLCQDSTYAYHSGDSGTEGRCAQSGGHLSCNQVVTVGGYHDVSSERAMVAAVAQQPVAIGISASDQDFQLYSSGVFAKHGCGSQPDHAVLAVGYGVSKGMPYWKVKNSWGASWGSEGYIFVARGNGQCGIGSYMTYPTGVKAVGKPLPPSPAPAPVPPPAPEPPAPEPTADCTGRKSRSSCNSDSACTWCACRAVPSECWSLADAARLPRGVYRCDAHFTDEERAIEQE